MNEQLLNALRELRIILRDPNKTQEQDQYCIKRVRELFDIYPYEMFDAAYAVVEETRGPPYESRTN